MKKVCFLLFAFLVCVLGVNGQKLTQEEYIEKYKNLAISEMLRTGVPASVTLAQGILETESGNSPLVMRSNNHFGIKCKSNWNGPTVSHDDDERDECFRAYSSAEESYRDHSDFLKNNARYGSLFNLEPTNYKDWAYGLKQAGYATNPRYAEMLIRFIETNNLQQYDTANIFLASATDQEPSYAIFNEDVVQNTLPVTVKTPEYFAFSAHVINGSKAIFVPEGTSLLAIATKQKIHLSKLLEINDLKKDGLLEKGQFIFLEKKASQGEKDFHIVQEEETIYDVAQKNGVLLQSILVYNKLKENDRLNAGIKILLKQPSSNSTTVVASSAVESIKNIRQEKEVFKHKVEPKEGLYSISKRFGISVAELKDWNKLTGDNLKIGQELIIIK
jgi:LysM repeat protein